MGLLVFNRVNGIVITMFLKDASKYLKEKFEIFPTDDLIHIYNPEHALEMFSVYENGDEITWVCKPLFDLWLT